MKDQKKAAKKKKQAKLQKAYKKSYKGRIAFHCFGKGCHVAFCNHEKHDWLHREHGKDPMPMRITCAGRNCVFCKLEE